MLRRGSEVQDPRYRYEIPEKKGRRELHEEEDDDDGGDGERGKDLLA